MSRSILPFRVTTNFNLGLFLKNEKSALRLGGSSTRLHSSTTLEERFSDVDDYVTHEYWSLDVEFLFCCIGPILWSANGLFLVYQILPQPCVEQNRGVLLTSVAVFILNLVETFVTIGLLIFAKYHENWHIKIAVLVGTIGVKLFLTAFNFVVAIVCMLSKSCGFFYSIQLHEYDDEGVPEPDGDPVHSTPLPAVRAEDIGSAIIDGFRYYDVKIIGVCLVLGSVGIAIGAMILLVKRNDIKMYVLWRLGKLDQYIDDTYNHND